MSKRKRLESGPALNQAEKDLLAVIKSKEDKGINSAFLKREANIPANMFTNSLTSLVAHNLIKEVTPIHRRGKVKHFMATEFEPCKEMFGGEWFKAGALDKEAINKYKESCLIVITRLKVATMEMIKGAVMRQEKTIKDPEQVEEIVRILVLESSIVEVKSSGLGEFEKIEVGRVCYKVGGRKGGDAGRGALASVPCGVCPRISQCYPDGIISPLKCEYFVRWLNF